MLLKSVATSDSGTLPIFGFVVYRVMTALSSELKELDAKDSNITKLIMKGMYMHLDCLVLHQQKQMSENNKLTEMLCKRIEALEAENKEHQLFVNSKLKTIEEENKSINAELLK